MKTFYDLAQEINLIDEDNKKTVFDYFVLLNAPRDDFVHLHIDLLKSSAQEKKRFVKEIYLESVYRSLAKQNCFFDSRVNLTFINFPLKIKEIAEAIGNNCRAKYYIDKFFSLVINFDGARMRGVYKNDVLYLDNMTRDPLFVAARVHDVVTKHYKNSFSQKLLRIFRTK